jgi:hypothetical protein
MSLNDLIAMCRSRLAYLSQLRTSAVALGDTAQVERIDAETAQTQTTLNRLQTLI